MFLIDHANGQAQCFAQVSLDRSNVYVQQPFKITITVLTATWYTAALDFENLQVPNAFILPFDQTSPGMFTIHNKQYAGLQFYFIVFPYHAGNFTVPSIRITATTPPEGSSVSKQVIIHTESKGFSVRGVPENMEGKNWFVAKNVLVSEKWNKSLDNIKVGDIIERTVTIDARGTLPQFIPQLSKDSLDFASTYVQDPALRDERSDYDANGRLTQSIIYLFEKEGDYSIPAIGVAWWNPNSSKRYSRDAPGKNIHVRANPNLGMMATIKDSLRGTQTIASSTKPKKTSYSFFGIPWYWFLSIALGTVLLLYELIRVLVRLIKNYRIQHAQYLLSEQYAFKNFMHSPLELKALLNNLYRWWDRLQFPGKTAAPSWQMRQEHYGNIQKDLNSYFKIIYGSQTSEGMAEGKFKNQIKNYRKKLGSDTSIESGIVISPYQKPLR
jgi:BatD DUF11 like domain